MTKRPDEYALWEAVKAGETPRAAGVRLGIHPKRVRRLCQKWWRKRIYDYGTSVDTGWVKQCAAGPVWKLEQDANGQWIYVEARGPEIRYAGLR